jgi:endonuclease/exonuclease/phosphatase family metal-dependent hydrolase
MFPPNLANVLRKRRCARFFLFLVLNTCWITVNTAFADDNGSKLRVMTQNLYDGTDRTGFLTATTFDEFLAAVDFAYNNMNATKPMERLTAIANEISASKADIVGLQEASIWRTGPSSLTGTTTPAENVQFDFLTILLDKLRTLGQNYVAVAVLPGLDVQLPSTLGFDVRLTDRDAIIVRRDLDDRDYQVTNLQEQNYLTQKVYKVSLLNNAEFTERAGWVSIDLVRDKLKTTRFVATHLNFDPLFDPTIANAQANELLGSAGKTSIPTVMLGDFNSNANSSSDPTNLTYRTIIGGNFKDAWNVAHGAMTSLTCCEDENLQNAFSKLSVRYDFVFVRGLSVLDAKVVGDKSADKTPSGLWPSDHAGVIATLQ